jgi:uncharacterized protein
MIWEIDLLNKLMKMKINPLLLTILLFVLTLSSYAQNELQVNKKSPLYIGETIEVESKILDQTRTINIYLPSNYSKDGTKKYDVIYLLDGGLDEDFIHISGIVQFLTLSWINKLDESIVVGIANTDRKRDFTFPTRLTKDKTDFPSNGHSASFISFLEMELQPFIAEHYRTTANKTLIGQSLGGLLATEILFKFPDLFDSYIIVSPSLWWDSGSLLDMDQVNISGKKSIYIAVGKEGEMMEQAARTLHKKISAAELKGLELYFDFFENQSHGDVLHLAVYSTFEKIFSSKKVD